MPREWTFRLSNATIMPEKHEPFPQDWMNWHSLHAAILIAQEMVAAALEQLGLLRKDLAANGAAPTFPWRQTGGQGTVSPRISTDRRDDTIRALAKYFSIQPTDPGYRENVGKIIAAYQKVQTGLADDFDIVVFRPAKRDDSFGLPKPVGARGFVDSEKPENKDLYRQYLDLKRKMIARGATPHKYWGTVGKGKIHLSLSLFIEGGHENGPEAIARTLVHEASHKFAGTKDHLYKHESYNHLFDGQSEDLASALAMDELQPSKVAKGGTRYEFGKPVARGPVVPMYGLKGDKLVSKADQFIENADSYAWAARRIWKRYR